MYPDDLRQAMPIIRQRCEEIGRDPDTLRVSVHVWWEHAREAGDERIERLAAYRELGVSRVQSLVRDSVDSDEPLMAFVEDCVAAGIDVETAPAAAAGVAA